MNGPTKTRRRRSRTWPLLALLLVVAGGAAAYWYSSQGEQADLPVWRTATIARGPLASTVSASGTLRAVVTVEVGSQISGQIKELYADFNSEVKANQKIALIDPATFQAKLQEAEADLAIAKGSVSVQRSRLHALAADIRAAQAALTQAKADYDRKKELMPTRAITKSDFDKAEAAFNQAKAKLDAAVASEAQQRAQLEVARAQILQKDAIVRQRRLDLDRTVIRSPVDGVVIARNIDKGQTVAASLQAPVLFTIAKNLRHMQVEVSVDEADIGRIRVGQQVEFTVDSFQGRTFPGEVKQIRLQPKEVSNVITYTVIVSAENADLRLLPGMTANVTFSVSRREAVLLVPNRALRFRPPGAQTQRATGRRRSGQGNAFVRRLSQQLALNAKQKKELQAIFASVRAKLQDMRRRGANREAIMAELRKMRARLPARIMDILTPDQQKKYRQLSRRRETNPVRRSQVWTVTADGQAKAVTIWTGISDGRVTEVVRGPLKQGDKVITGISTERRRRGLRLGF